VTVTVYTTPSCAQCETTKRLLDRNHIDYSVVDLSKDEEALTMVRGLGYSAAPVVIAGDEHWSGFRLERLNGLVTQLTPA
jgi:glutaredoxin-like protein NrdH